MILWSLIDPEDRSDFKKGARQLLTRQGNHPPLCASLPVLGELTMLLATKHDANRFEVAMQNLHALIRRGKLQVSWMRTNEPTLYQSVAQVHACDRDMDAADALIIACALLDDRAHVLHTADSYVGSKALQQMFKDQGKELRAIDA